MQYAADSTNAFAFAVHKWKPITPEQFAKEVHFWATKTCDEGGNSGVGTRAYYLDRHCRGTMYYRHKITGDIAGEFEVVKGVRTPFVMTMNSKEGKVICFEYIGDGGDGVPEAHFSDPA